MDSSYVGLWMFLCAYHDDGHPSCGVVVLRSSVKVCLQFTCDLHLHVVLHDCVVLHTHKHALRWSGTMVFHTRNYLSVQMQIQTQTVLWATVTQWWERMSCAVYRASALTCSIFPISSCNKTHHSLGQNQSSTFFQLYISSIPRSCRIVILLCQRTHNEIRLGYNSILLTFYCE